MPRVRKIQPLPYARPSLDVQLFATATAVPFAISLDRKVLFGAAATPTTILYQSVDDGTTWTSVHTFTTGETVQGLRETDDGEALVFTTNTAATVSYVYKSSGWTASRTAATWTKVNTFVSSVRAYWGGGHVFSFGDDLISAGSSKYGIVNEYGAQFSGANAATAATRVYFSGDYGATWTQVLDLVSRYPGKTPLHVHASAYDPYWDRLWVTYGDTQGETDTTRQGLLYSDDHGVTWTAVALPTEWATVDYLQSTAIGVFEDCLLLGSDNRPGILRLSRQGYRTPGPAQIVAAPGFSNISQMLANGLHRNRRHPAAPILMAFNSAHVTVPGGVLASYDGGLTFAELHRDPFTSGAAGMDWTQVFGPTYNGYIVGYASAKLVRGEVVWSDAGTHDGTAFFTGDATTTVFNVPHGLGVVPTRFDGWSTNAVGGTYTVTADATNIIFTYATAPASGAFPAVGFRYAP